MKCKMQNRYIISNSVGGKIKNIDDTTMVKILQEPSPIPKAIKMIFPLGG